MKQKILILVLAAMTASMAATGCESSTKKEEETTDAVTSSEAEESTDEESSSEEGADSDSSDFGTFDAFAEGSSVTYSNLFDVILSSEYDQIWIDKVVAVTGDESSAQETVDGLKASITSDIYGEEAYEKYNGQESFAFDCEYINDAKSFTFSNDKTVSIEKTDGSTEKHTYEYLGSVKIGEGEKMTYQGQEMDVAFDVDAYKSTDDAGEFTYILLRDDTMESTYHIEFRYGSDLDELKKYMEGNYAYWLAAGIDKDADEETIENCINLFVTENVQPAESSDENNG